MTRYLEEAINHDRPAMQEAGASRETTHALDAAYGEVLAVEPHDGRRTSLFTEILDQRDHVTEARRARLVFADGILPG